MRDEGGICILGSEGLLGAELLKTFNSLGGISEDGVGPFASDPTWRSAIEKQSHKILSTGLSAFVNNKRAKKEDGFSDRDEKRTFLRKFFSRVRGFARKDCDITDDGRVSEILREFKPDLILNGAAYTNVDRAEAECDEAWDINTRAVGVLACEAAAIGARLVHFSTDFVYERARTPVSGEMYQRGCEGFREEDQPVPPPKGKYALSKLEGERKALNCNPKRTLVVRVGNLYGGSGKNFPSLLARRLQVSEEHHRLLLDSSRVMSPTWARCVALQVLCLVLNDAPGGLYHSTCRGSTTWAGFAEEICRLLKISTKFKKVSSKDLNLPAPRPESHVLKNAALQGLGLDIMPHWKSALAGYLAQCGFIPEAGLSG